MRFAKAFVLAALVAVAATAFVGASTASAQHEIVLCKELVTLCPNGSLWPSLTKLFALAENPELESSLGIIKCPDSEVTAEIATDIGAVVTTKNITGVFGSLHALELGKTLGEGCTGPCVQGQTEAIHVTLEALELIVEPIDKYSLRGTGLALILKCPFGVTCVYRGTNVITPIVHDGKHARHPNATNLPLAKFEETLARQTTHGGSSLCPSTSLWRANYVLYLAESGGVAGLVWPSLDKKA
jgi:hypothetical protein